MILPRDKGTRYGGTIQLFYTWELHPEKYHLFLKKLNYLNDNATDDRLNVMKLDEI